MKLLSITLRAVATLGLVAPVADATGYLVVSSPNQKAVMYAKLLTAAEQARGDQMNLFDLGITAVSHPLSIAVDSLRGVLYVSDPQAKTVLAMRISEATDNAGRLFVDSPSTVLSDWVVHGLAVDNSGTLFAADHERNKIVAIRGRTVLDRLNSANKGNISAVANTDLYTATDVSNIKAPQGMATDGFQVYWANGQEGTSKGTIVKGAEERGDNPQDSITQLDASSDAAYGVCLTPTRVFYTYGNGVFTMPTNGGTQVKVNDGFNAPRGCVYDGDGTVFVADRTAGKVYSFSGGATNMDLRPISVALTMSDAYGLALFQSPAAKQPVAFSLILAFLVFGIRGVRIW